MTKQFRKFLMAGAAGVAIMLAQADHAQAQAISGGLRVQITSTDGTPISGATVKIVGEATGTAVNATTDANGTFSASSLPVQTAYTVTVTAPGYPAKTVSHVTLQLGSTLQMPIELVAENETVVVTGQRARTLAAINESAGVIASYNAAAIQNTPTLDSSLREIVQKAPFAYVDPVGGGSSPPIPTTSFAGTNPRCTNILVDGVQQKDNFGLNASGTTSTRDAIPLEWAASVQVALTPYDVQYNDTCGGVVNVVTKSGTNDFHGSVYGYYKDASMNGTDFALWNNNTGTTAVTKTTIRPTFVEKRYGGDLSGSIIPDTLFFFVGYDELKRSSSPGATAVGPAGSNYTSVAQNISTAQVNQIIADAKNIYGFNAGNLADNFSEYNQRYIAKLTWQINDDHALTGSYQHVTGAQLAINNGSSSSSLPRVNLPSNWYENAQKNEVYQLQETDHWTSNLTTEETIGHLGVRQAPTSLDGTNFPEVDVQTPGADGDITTIADNGYVRLGPDFSRQYNLLLYTNNYAKALATYVLGEHTFEAGAEYHRIGIDDKFVQGAQSVVRFDSEADFAAGKISQNVNTATNGIASDVSAASGFPVYIASGYDPTTKTFNNVAADGLFSFGISSLFIQDTFYPLKDMTVLFGLRYDRYSTNPGGIVANPFFQQRYGFTNQLTLDGLDALLPRVSVKYNYSPDLDFLPDSLITFRGGVGEYSGGFQTVWITNNYDTTGVNTLSAAGIPGKPIGSYLNVDPTKTPGTTVAQIVSFAGVPTILPTDHQAWLQDLISAATAPLASASAVKTSTVDAQLPSFRLPKSLRQNAGFDLLFGDGYLGPNWQFSFDYVNINSYDNPYWTNLRIMPSGNLAPDGRTIYRYTFDTAHPDPVTNAQLTGTDIGLGSIDGGNSTLFTVDLQNSWKDTGFGDFTVDLAYTHSKVSDVSSATSSTAGSNYGNIARTNFNDPEVGTSDYERVHRITLNLSVAEDWIGKEFETRFNLFGQRMSGEHYSLVFNGEPFGPSGTSGKSLLYIPKVDPTTGLVTPTSDPSVTYGTAFGSFADFNAMLQKTGLIKYAGKIAPRNSETGPWSTLINVSMEQDFPGFDEGHRFVLAGEIFNLPNLLNPAWGGYVSPNFYQAFQAVTATVTGGKYNYTAFQNQAAINSNLNSQRISSTYQIQMGIRYEF